MTLPGLPTVSVAETPMGLSGGMAFLARDLFESGAPQPRQADPADVPATLVRHLRHRLIHSFLGDGVVEQWLRWTAAAPDHSTWLLGEGVFPHTVRASRTIIALLDEGVLCPIGVILTSSPRPRDVFANHVALVYGYQLHGRRLTLHVYDCDRPCHDGITISLDIGSAAPVSPVVTNGTDMTRAPGRARGFFSCPTSRQGPPPAATSGVAASAAASGRPARMPGARPLRSTDE